MRLTTGTEAFETEEGQVQHDKGAEQNEALGTQCE